MTSTLGTLHSEGYVITIQDYGSAVNSNTTHSKVVHKYIPKLFYNRTNKKEYNMQIWEYNVCYTNIIEIKDIPILEKKKEREKLSEEIADTTTPAERAPASGLVYLI